MTEFSPQALNKTAARDSRFRWPMIVGVGGLAVLLILALVFVPGTSQQRADERSAEYSAALVAINEHLGGSQQMLAVLTDPQTPADDANAFVPQLTALQAEADSALTLAEQALPGTLPLAPTGPIDALVPLRDAVAGQATAAESISRRLSTVLEYRSLFSSFDPVPSLPVEANGVDINALGSSLATATAQSQNVVDGLPDDAALAAHKTAGSALLDTIDDGQFAYLDALRSGDTDAATSFVARVMQAQTDLATLFDDALSRLRGEIDPALVAVSSAIVDALEAG